MTSAPASAWTTAICASTSKVSSLAIRPSRTIPSWPSDEYGSSATSVMTTSSGAASLTARTASGNSPSGFSPSLPVGSLSSSRMAGKRATAGMPSSWSAAASSARRSKLNRYCPGIDATSCRTSAPSTTNSGATRLSTESLVSRAIRLRFADARSRRGRWSSVDGRVSIEEEETCMRSTEVG